VLCVLTRMNRILELDPRDRIAVVQPGVINLALQTAAAKHGLAYAPLAVRGEPGGGDAALGPGGRTH